MDRKLFYNKIKPLFGSFTISQVKGIEVFLNYYETSGIDDLRQLACILGNVYWETDKTFSPIEEYGKGDKKPYGKKLKMSGDAYSLPNKIYYGRGYTQNTWYENYAKLTSYAKAEGKDWDFFNNPELLLIDKYSVWATFTAMTKGLYTGKKLSDYFNTTTTDFYNARRIVNGLDKAKEIEGFSKIFYNALTK